MVTTNNFVGIAFDRGSDNLMVWERPIEGGPRTMHLAKPPRYFYIQDDNGTYTSMYDEPLKRLDFEDQKEFDAASRRYPQKYESDIKPEYKYLMNTYYKVSTPKVNYSFFDIEVDYKGIFAGPKNPYAPVNAVTIYNQWQNKYITIAVPPPGWQGRATFKESLLKEAKRVKLKFVPDVRIVNTERELFDAFFEAIEDADIISGWNSEFYDIPYMIQRATIIGGDRYARKFCLPGAPRPRMREVNKFGATEIVYSLYGRTHLDYQALFKKFTFEGRISYSLANIAADELDTPKLEYDGTLEQLYMGTYIPDYKGTYESTFTIEDELFKLNCQRAFDRANKQIETEAKNLSFVRFVVYNIRDVEVLVDLDLKFKFMNLVNQMAHESTCQFADLLGTVRYVETDITNIAHHDFNVIISDHVESTVINEVVEGAIVMTPIPGLHKNMGAIDIKSLYPNTMIALNLSIETFVGQFTTNVKAWVGIMVDKDSNYYELVFTDGTSLRMTGKEWHDYLIENDLIISAYGSVFRQDKQGIVAYALALWFDQRKALQKEKKKFGSKYSELLKTTGISLKDIEI